MRSGRKPVSRWTIGMCFTFRTTETQRRHREDEQENEVAQGSRFKALGNNLEPRASSLEHHASLWILWCIDVVG